MIATIRNYLQHTRLLSPPAKAPAAAYNAWAASYDVQPGNLMIDLDEQVFGMLLQHTCIANKRIADIGCGTGRHWKKMHARKPALITGFDVSAGMLEQLTKKFPDAVTRLVTDNRLAMVPDHFADCIVCTLTIAHIKNIHEAIAAWSRILKPGGDLLITDFHPALLAKGGARTFRHQGKQVTVNNYVHPLSKVIKICNRHGLRMAEQEERYINEDIKHYYVQQHALQVYDRFRNMPVIYGLRLKKDHGAE